MSVPTRSLGRNGPQVAAVGFGTMSLGGAYGQKDTAEAKLEVSTELMRLANASGIPQMSTSITRSASASGSSALARDLISSSLLRESREDGNRNYRLVLLPSG